MNFDGQYLRTESLGDVAKGVKVHECHCHINDSFEMLSATWGRYRRKLDNEKIARAERIQREKEAAKCGAE